MTWLMLKIENVWVSNKDGVKITSLDLQKCVSVYNEMITKKKMNMARTSMFLAYNCEQ